MPTDWLIYFMTRPLGLAVIALFIAVTFAIWRLVLGKSYASVGLKPLALAYALAAIGFVVTNLASAYLEFSTRVSNGLLEESARWDTVPNWTIYSTVLGLVFVLPLLGLIGVPLSALLLKSRRLTYSSIIVCAVVLWIAVATLAWSFPTNEWHATHRLESFWSILKDLFPVIALVAMPFMLGTYAASRAFRHERT